MKKKKIKQRNFVQMHVQEFNTPKVFADRKKKSKSGYIKYKKNLALCEQEFTLKKATRKKRMNF